MRRSFLVLAFLLFTTALAIAACEEQVTPQRCTDIPKGGCPLSHGVACEDPACEAAYACLEGNVWELDHRCPAHDASVVLDAGSIDADASEPSSFDASIDAPEGAFGGPGCGPLQTPDCSLGLALACPSGCCDCEDLYICRSGGWQLWGSCSASGIEPSSP